MKTASAFLLASLLFASLAIAGPPHTAGPFADIDKLAVLLDLDDGQKAAVDSVFEQRRQAAEAHREAVKASGVRPTREEMEARRAAGRDSLRSEMQGILSAQQFEKFEVLMDSWPHGRHARGGPRGGCRGKADGDAGR